MMSLDYTSKEEGFKYEIQLMKEGQSKKSKVTAKKHLEEVNTGKFSYLKGLLFPTNLDPMLFILQVSQLTYFMQISVQNVNK